MCCILLSTHFLYNLSLPSSTNIKFCKSILTDCIGQITVLVWFHGNQNIKHDLVGDDSLMKSENT